MWQHLIEAIPPLLNPASQSQEALNLLKGERPAAFLPFWAVDDKAVPHGAVEKCSEMQRNVEKCRKM